MSWSQHELLSFSTSPSAAPRLFYPEAGLFRLRDGKWPQGNHGQDVPCATLVCLLVVAQGPGRQPRPAFFLCPGLTNYDRRGEAQRPDWTAHVWPEILNGAPKCPSFQRREKKERQASRGTLTPDAAPTTTARVTQNPLSFPSPSNTSQKEPAFAHACASIVVSFPRENRSGSFIGNF